MITHVAVILPAEHYFESDFLKERFVKVFSLNSSKFIEAMKATKVETNRFASYPNVIFWRCLVELSGHFCVNQKRCAKITETSAPLALCVGWG